MTREADTLRGLQAPLKDLYRREPGEAQITLEAKGRIGDNVTCKVDTGRALAQAGLHPATGGDGSTLCSGDMLLEALVACAGVTLNAVATALEIELRDAEIQAAGDLDFRGTLGMDKTAPVGFKEIRLGFRLDTDADDDRIDNLLKLTERYCVVFQSLSNRPSLVVNRVAPDA